MWTPESSLKVDEHHTALQHHVQRWAQGFLRNTLPADAVLGARYTARSEVQDESANCEGPKLSSTAVNTEDIVCELQKAKEPSTAAKT